MHFLEAGLPRDGRRRVLVEGPEVSRKLKLLTNADLLVAEDCGRSTNLSVRRQRTGMRA